MRKVFVKAVIRLGSEDPDFRSVLSPLESRRMGRLLKRAVWTSMEALKRAGIDMPDAVITATDWGCISNSEAFLDALKAADALRPVHFMQSTHNTISSAIAIRLGCHGYNATYSQRGSSFRDALEDAAIQIRLGDIDTALVGWFDEKTARLEESECQCSDTAISVVLSSKGETELNDNTILELCGN